MARFNVQQAFDSLKEAVTAGFNEAARQIKALDQKVKKSEQAVTDLQASKADVSHTHTVSEVNGLSAELERYALKTELNNINVDTSDLATKASVDELSELCDELSELCEFLYGQQVESNLNKLKDASFRLEQIDESVNKFDEQIYKLGQAVVSLMSLPIGSVVYCPENEHPSDGEWYRADGNTILDKNTYDSLYGVLERIGYDHSVPGDPDKLRLPTIPDLMPGIVAYIKVEDDEFKKDYHNF